jgi:U3 small nucleolar RNA-associated protein 14
MKNFTVEEIDSEVFIDLCLDEELLAKSPLATVLDMDPEDVWPNAESLIAQIKAASQQAKLENTPSSSSSSSSS